MCLRRAPEKYIAGTKAPSGAALDRAALKHLQVVFQSSEGPIYKGILSSMSFAFCTLFSYYDRPSSDSMVYVIYYL
jgi:hypothetical protein